MKPAQYLPWLAVGLGVAIFASQALPFPEADALHLQEFGAIPVRKV